MPYTQKQFASTISQAVAKFRGLMQDHLNLLSRDASAVMMGAGVGSVAQHDISQLNYSHFAAAKAWSTGVRYVRNNVENVDVGGEPTLSAAKQQFLKDIDTTAAPPGRLLAGIGLEMQFREPEWETRVAGAAKALPREIGRALAQLEVITYQAADKFWPDQDSATPAVLNHLGLQSSDGDWTA